MHIEELAAGILLISHHGGWTVENWHESQTAITEALADQHRTLYFLLDLTQTTHLVDAEAFEQLLLQSGAPGVGLAIMLGKRAQSFADTLIRTRPHLRDRINLRFMASHDDALQALLDRQVLDQMNDGSTVYGRTNP